MSGATASVAASQRHTSARPCRVCGGHMGLPRGHGKRCHGYRGFDGRYDHCSREEHAGNLPEEDGQTWAHRLDGPCGCGETHGEAELPARIVLGSAATYAEETLGPVEAEYLYPLADGTVRHKVTRHRDPKDFRPWHVNGTGAWKKGKGGESFPPYRLPELLAAEPAEPVLKVEGEKDADLLIGRGFVATTNDGGAEKWTAEHSSYLAGRNVVILPDNDPAGERDAAKTAQSLAGIARKVAVLWLPGLPPSGDGSDWYELGGTDEELRRLVAAALEETPDAPCFVWRLPDLLVTDFPAQEPLVAGIIDRGGATSLFGAGNTGKTWVAFSIGLNLSAGRPWLGRFAIETPARVLIVDQEGRPAKAQERLRRLAAAEDVPTDLPLIYARPSGWRIDTDAGYAQLGALIEEHAPDLVILDSGTRFHGADENKSQEMAAVSQRHAELTTDRGIALLIIDHANKFSVSDDPRARLRGSTDKLNALDAALFVERQVGSTTLSVTPVKSRYDVELPPFAITFDHRDGMTRMAYEDSAAMTATPDDALAMIHRLSADEPYGATVDTIGFALFPTPAMTSSQRGSRTRNLLQLLERQGRVARVDVPRDGSRGGRKFAYQARD